MKKDYRVYCEDIIDAIDKIQGYLSDKKETQFSRDTQLQDAVIRRLGIIGEAAAKLPRSLRDRAESIPWKSIVGLRNIVIHEYANVSLGKVWDVTQHDLTNLKAQVARLLDSLPDPTSLDKKKENS